jgi:exopolyphosphatase / guanosine-5'-triphosphate,3'-diphosphate pyrophosphatase
MWGRHHDRVPVGVIDVGSNTVRLLVTGGGRTLLTIREPLGLGAAVEQAGSIPADKLDEAADVVGAFADEARRIGVDELEVLITSPGRQAANGEDLLDLLAIAARAPARVLTAVEEGRLAFAGALEGAGGLVRRRVAVVDVGGGSAQVAVGTRTTGPTWVRSLDIGSLRLTRRCLTADPPGHDALHAARDEVERLLEGFDPPEPQAALAVGGTARSLRRLIGNRLGRDELEDVLDLLAVTPERELIDRHDLPPHRAGTIAAGAVIFAALQERLRTPLKVSRTGLREGALSQLAERRAAA